MGIELNIDEVFDMAEKIEQDAAAFYTQAASASGDTVRREVLLRLASMEADHVHVFAGMRARLDAGSAADRLETGEDVRKNWGLLVNLLESGITQDLAKRFTGREASDQILLKALEFEKDTIVFFLGLKNALSRPEDKETMDGIIREELGHILTLTGELAAAR